MHALIGGEPCENHVADRIYHIQLCSDWLKYLAKILIIIKGSKGGPEFVRQRIKADSKDIKDILDVLENADA